MFLESFSKLELCILQHNVSLDSVAEAGEVPPRPRAPLHQNRKAKWRPWKTGETEYVCTYCDLWHYINVF